MDASYARSRTRDGIVILIAKLSLAEVGAIAHYRWLLIGLRKMG
jgi:hypothetical protein